MRSVLVIYGLFFFFKQKTAYEMRISDWSSDVCSSDLNDAVNESIETCSAEVQFDERRRAVLGVLGFDAERATVTSGRYSGDHIGPLVERLMELPDPVVMEVAAVVMAETLATGSDLIETLGANLSVGMRSEESGVGKEGVSPCSSRGAPDN